MSTTGPDAVTPSTTAPAVTAPRWSGRKTAVAAALALGFGSAGALVAAATFPQGSLGFEQGRDGGGRGGFPPGGFVGRNGPDGFDPSRVPGPGTGSGTGATG